MVRQTGRSMWQALRRRPGVSAAVIGALGVGLAANALMVAVIDAAILRPFPYAEPDRLVGVGSAYPRLNRALSFFETISAPEFVDIQRDARTLDHVIAFDLNNEAVILGDRPERVFTAFVWGDPLATLRTRPVLGRGFTPEEVDAGHPVALVSHAFWTSTLGGSPSAVGTRLGLQGRLYEIVGVLPARARLYGTDLWVPMTERAATLPRNRRQFNVLARMAPDASAESVAADLEQVARRIETTHGAAVPEYAQFQLGARPWTEIDAWGLRSVTYVAFGATALVLLLVTANLASLLLARAASRRREAAVRAALGASRGRLAGELFFESGVQAGAGAILALALAWLAVRALPSILPDGLLPAGVELAINVRVMLAVSAGAVLAGLLVGIAPALQLARVHPGEILNEDNSRTAGARGTRRLHALVVALEVGVALVVMASAALVTLTTVRLLQVDRGFDASRLTIMRITLPVNRYDGERSLAFFDGLLARVRALPYVRHASASNQPPPGVFSRAQFEIEGQPPRAGATLPSTFFSTVASSYRETIGLRLKQGRWFDETAPATGTREVVVNAAFAARYFADRSPVGQRVRVQAPAGDGRWTDIVGLVDDVRNAGLSANPQPEMLASVRQIPERRRTQLYVVARTRDAGDPIAADVRGIVQSIDPEQPIYAVSTIEQQFANGVSSRRAAAWVLGFFCVLSAGLAGLGIFGVLSFAANERAREIAVRVALGGRRSSIVRLMLSQAMRPVVAGLLLGGAMVILGERVIAGWAFGVTPEPAVVAGVAVALFVVGLVASAWPAIRASRTSPVDALRGS